MKIKEIVNKPRNKSLFRIMTTRFRYIRGYIISLKFNHPSFISVRGKTKIISKNGIISIGNFTDLWPGVKLSSSGTTKPIGPISK